MSRRTLRLRRGSALILVLLMTLAVAGLAIAAIFLSSSAGLLSRFYDREREFRLGAESALEFVLSQLLVDSTMAIPDTGVVQLLAGHTISDASDAVIPRVAVNVFAAATGDTTALGVPHLTLIAAAYDANGTRHVRRVDLRRESFSRYSLFADRFNASLVFSNGTVTGRVHTNETWRSGAAAVYKDTVTARVAFAGTGTFRSDSASGVPSIPFPSDSTYPRLDTLAALANLSFAPVNTSGSGWRTGSRLQFVTVDADGDGTLEPDEGFVRVFDLADGNDTTRLNVGLAATDYYNFWSGLAKRWDDPVVQNQCGASYLRAGRWHFIPVATHRSSWARNVIQATGSGNFPAVTNPVMNSMDDYDYNAAQEILSQTTARCHPAGSPFLLSTERKTNAFGVVTGTAADSVPFGVVTPPGGWPADAPYGYGGNDTTFTVRARTCRHSSGGTSGRCDGGTLASLGAWRAFGGTAVSGVPTTVRQAAELPFLWPFTPTATRNPASRRVVHAAAGPLFISGEVRGRVLLHVDGAVRIIEHITTAPPATEAAFVVCEDQLGVLAVGDILVADNALTRGRRVAQGLTSANSIASHLGPSADVEIHASLMSTTGTVGVEGASGSGVAPQQCPIGGSNNTSGGCFRQIGGMAMRNFSQLFSGGNSGLRYAGSSDTCQREGRRPPYYPLTNRTTMVRTLEIAPARANTPAKIRALLMRLKGSTL